MKTSTHAVDTRRSTVNPPVKGRILTDHRQKKSKQNRRPTENSTF